MAQDPTAIPVAGESGDDDESDESDEVDKNKAVKDKEKDKGIDKGKKKDDVVTILDNDGDYLIKNQFMSGKFKIVVLSMDDQERLPWAKGIRFKVVNDVKKTKGPFTKENCQRTVMHNSHEQCNNELEKNVQYKMKAQKMKAGDYWKVIGNLKK